MKLATAPFFAAWLVPLCCDSVVCLFADFLQRVFFLDPKEFTSHHFLKFGHFIEIALRRHLHQIRANNSALTALN